MTQLSKVMNHLRFSMILLFLESKERKDCYYPKKLRFSLVSTVDYLNFLLGLKYAPAIKLYATINQGSYEVSDDSFKNMIGNQI